MKNIENFKNDLKLLIQKGEKLDLSIKYECYPENFERQIKETIKDEKKVKELIKNILPFRIEYQSWYSESIVLLKQILPDRLSDFIRLYEKPKSRKVIEYGNYVIEDYLQSLTVTSGYGQKKVGPEAAIYQFEQQLYILKSIERRFESTLFDLRQLVQAEMFDNELDAAKHLHNKMFYRASGMLSGVVLERHLYGVCESHNLAIPSKPTISNYNELLKNNELIDLPTWRYLTLLGDYRNICSHSKEREPTMDESRELLEGVAKIIKKVY